MVNKEDKARPTTAAKEEDKAQHMIVEMLVGEAGSATMVLEEDKAQHLVVGIVAKEVDEAT